MGLEEGKEQDSGSSVCCSPQACLALTTWSCGRRKAVWIHMRGWGEVTLDGTMQRGGGYAEGSGIPWVCPGGRATADYFFQQGGGLLGLQKEQTPQEAEHRPREGSGALLSPWVHSPPSSKGSFWLWEDWVKGGREVELRASKVEP